MPYSLNHHAYYIVGHSALADRLIEFLEKNHGIKYSGNPDFHFDRYENFLIDHARQLKSLHENLPISSEAKRIFVLDLKAITSEAQNALLKLLEEPGKNTHFFIILPTVSLLLPTVLSRLQLLDWDLGNNEPTSGDHKEALDFLKMPISQRLKYIKDLADDLADEKISRSAIVEFVESLEAVIYEKEGISKSSNKLETISQALTYARDRSSSLKMLLEYVALNV